MRCEIIGWKCHLHHSTSDRSRWWLIIIAMAPSNLVFVQTVVLAGSDWSVQLIPLERITSVVSWICWLHMNHLSYLFTIHLRSSTVWVKLRYYTVIRIISSKVRTGSMDVRLFQSIPRNGILNHLLHVIVCDWRRNYSWSLLTFTPIISDLKITVEKLSEKDQNTPL